MSKRIKVILVCLANRNIGGGLLVASRARDCVGAETIGTVGILGLRELSPAPFSSFPGFLSLVPPRVRDRGAHLLWGLARDVGGRTIPRMTPTSLWRAGGNSRVVWGMGRGPATSKVHSRGVFEENLKFF